MSTVVRGAAAVAALALGMGTGASYAAAPLASYQPVDLGGQDIDGHTDADNPTPVEAGLWRDTLGRTTTSATHYFAYERQIKDSTVHIGVVAAPPTPDGDGVSIQASVDSPDSGDTIDCGTDDESYDSSVPQAVIGVQVVAGEEDDGDGDACRGADTVRITVSRTYTSMTADLPIALKVVEEAPVSDVGQPAPEGDEPQYDVPEPASAQTSPDGAASFDAAPILDAADGPVTLSTAVTEGSELLWRVPLDWGDQLVVRGDVPALSDAEQEELGYPTAYVRVGIVQRSRDTFVLTTGEESAGGSYGSDGARMVAASYPLRYTNREIDVPPTLPGDHWVTVAVAAPPEERAALDVPVELTVAVTHGDATPPTYQDAVLAQGGGAGPDGYSPRTPYLVGDGEFEGVASGNPFTPESDDESWWGPRRFAGLGLGIASLACCAVGAAWLARRRSG